MKRFVLCYLIGFVIMLRDLSTMITLCVVRVIPTVLDEMMDILNDIVLGEIVKGTLIHLATLPVNKTMKTHTGMTPMTSSVVTLCSTILGL
jgi:hypothetical protein